MEKQTLTKKEYLGTWNYVEFPDGTIQEISGEQYKNLSQFENFKQACKDSWKFDSENGLLADNEFAVIDGNYYIGRGGAAMSVSKEYLDENYLWQ